MGWVIRFGKICWIRAPCWQPLWRKRLHVESDWYELRTLPYTQSSVRLSKEHCLTRWRQVMGRDQRDHAAEALEMRDQGHYGVSTGISCSSRRGRPFMKMLQRSLIVSVISAFGRKLRLRVSLLLALSLRLTDNSCLFVRTAHSAMNLAPASIPVHLPASLFKLVPLIDEVAQGHALSALERIRFAPRYARPSCSRSS